MCVFFKQARSVIVTEPMNTTYKQAKTALRGDAVRGHAGRRGSRRRLPGSVLEGLMLPTPKELGWRKVGCLWRPRGFTSSSWMKPSVGFVHDFRRFLAVLASLLFSLYFQQFTMLTSLSASLRCTTPPSARRSTSPPPGLAAASAGHT